MEHQVVPLAGRLADPERALGTDPRLDPRLRAALAQLGLDAHTPPAPVSPASPRSAQLEFCAAAEAGFQGLIGAGSAGLDPVPGVTSETVTIHGPAGNDVSLYIHRPAEASGPLPCIYHIHGGGMAILTAADPGYIRWRDELAAAGLVVLGVEFRNSSGQLGSHPYPAGLDDCVAGFRWTSEHLGDIGGSHIVVSGESGGGNLSLATAIRAKREGWITDIAGVYALCPYISGTYGDPPAELVSLEENDGYFLACDLMAVLAEVYDPREGHASDPTCWPLRAGAADLEGLPPHVISVNELDPLRDEGVAYHRALLAAGVSSVGRVVLGTTHGADVIFRAAIPDVYAASIRDIAGFARSLG